MAPLVPTPLIKDIRHPATLDRSTLGHSNSKLMCGGGGGGGGGGVPVWAGSGS